SFPRCPSVLPSWQPRRDFPPHSPMKILRPFLTGALALAFAASLSAATLLPKKVVFTGGGIGTWRFTESEIAEMRKAAPTLDLVFPDRDHLAAELADADGVVGGLNEQQLKAAPKLRWMQVTSAGVENYMYPELRERPIAVTNMKIVQGVEIAD